MEKKEFSTKKKIVFSLMTILFFLAVISIIGEIVTRLRSEDKPWSEKSDLSDELGWRCKADYSADYKMQEQGKNARFYPVSYRTFKHGFRTWGDVKSGKPKVLFVGDSYIQAVEVSNDKLFYNILADSLNVEIFAYGQAGYGTLQQKMIIEKYIDEIQPDLIVLQTCDNDFVDNYAPLEYNSGYKVGLKRPYFNSNSKIKYRRAIPAWQAMVDKSEFFKLIRKKLTTLIQSSKQQPTAQELMAEQKEAYPPFAESIKITSLIIADMKKSIATVPIVAFSASPYEPQLSIMKRLFEEQGIPFFEKPGLLVHRETWKGIVVHSVDGFHWNEYGHKRIADHLAGNIGQFIENN